MAEINEPTSPAATTRREIGSPQMISSSRMEQLIEGGRATILSAQPRYSMFVRYGDSWWVANGEKYCEITDSEHNGKLSRWHQRLTQGALWT